MKKLLKLKVYASALTALLFLYMPQTAQAGAISTQENHDIPRPILIFAASSLTDVMKALSKTWVTESNNPKPHISLAPSATLARQITMGAPAHIIMTANTQWIDHLKKQNLIHGNTYIVAQNQLVIASIHQGKEGKATDALNASPKIIMAEPRLSPSGMYGLNFLKTLPNFELLQKKLIFTNNARASLHMIERTHYSGLIYKSDTLASKRIHIQTLIDPKLSGEIAYTAAMITNQAASPSRSATQQAASFISFIKSTSAQNIWLKHGFTLPARE